MASMTEKPVMLRSAEIDVPFPSPDSLDETDKWLNNVSASFVQHSAILHLKQSPGFLVSSFIAWAKMMFILEHILEELYSSAARRTASLVATGRMDEASSGARHMDGREAGETMEWKFRNILRMMIEWADDLPREIQWDGFFPTQGGSQAANARTRSTRAAPTLPGSSTHRGVPPQVLTLRGWASLCMLALHRPFIPQNLSSSALAASNNFLPCLSPPAQVCIGSANEILSLMDAYESIFPVRKIPSGWVFVLFQAGTIFSSFCQFKPISADVMQQVQQQGLQPQAEAATKRAQEVAQECQHQLARCIDKLVRIGHTHRAANEYVDILRRLSEVSAGMSRAASSTVGAQGVYTGDMGYGGMSERLLLEGFFSSMPFGQTLSSWQTFINQHLQPLRRD